MRCYCSAETSLWLFWTLINNNFVEFSKLNPTIEGDDYTNYCWRHWLLKYTK